MFSDVLHIGLDFDGVVVDSNAYFINEFLTIGNGLTGKNVSRRTIYNNWGTTLEDMLEIAFPGISLVTYYEERERLKLNQKIPPIVMGAPEAIEKISTLYSVSIITNRGGISFFEMIRDGGININHFENIQTSDDTDFDKPNPRVFDDFLVRYAAKEMLYVGDHLIDYKAALNAGIHFIAVLSGGISTREDFIATGLPENQILNSLADLPEFLGL